MSEEEKTRIYHCWVCKRKYRSTLKDEDNASYNKWEAFIDTVLQNVDKKEYPQLSGNDWNQGVCPVCTRTISAIAYFEGQYPEEDLLFKEYLEEEMKKIFNNILNPKDRYDL